MEELPAHEAVVRCGRDFVRFSTWRLDTGGYGWRADIRQRTAYGTLLDLPGFQKTSGEAAAPNATLQALRDWALQRGVKLKQADLLELARATSHLSG